jgi:hypothetical protein
MFRINFLLLLLLPVSIDAACRPSRAQQALQEAKKALEVYARDSDPADQETLLAYLPYFRSWGGYQAVTPAPYEVAEAIEASPAARAYVNKLQTIAKRFKTAPTGLAGGSTLSDNGVTFYEKVIKMTEDRLNITSNKSCMIIPKLETKLM